MDLGGFSLRSKWTVLFINDEGRAVSGPVFCCARFLATYGACYRILTWPHISGSDAYPSWS